MSTPPQDAEDFLYAFFQNAYHFCEYEPGGKEKEDVRKFINAHLVTRICRDFANLTKHHELNQKPAQEHELSILPEYVGENRGWYQPDTRLVIVTNYQDKGIVLDARDVAKECLRLWCEYLCDYEIVQSIKSHFQFSSKEFDEILSKALSKSEYAKNLMGHFLDDEVPDL